MVVEAQEAEEAGDVTPVKPATQKVASPMRGKSGEPQSDLKVVEMAANGVGDEEPKATTPFDGVLDMLKDGPLASRTPIVFPTPKSRQKGELSVPVKRLHTSFASPSVSQKTVADRDEDGGPKRNVAALGTFTFEATRSAHKRDSVVRRSTRGVGNGVKPFSSGPKFAMQQHEQSPAPLAWTPMRSTPASLGSRQNMPGSRKRRAEEDLSTPGTHDIDNGGISLLDMQRRRRFKPSDDPGSTGRRSWRAGRTPFMPKTAGLSRLRPGLVQADAEKDTPAAARVLHVDSPKPTSDTARRILATLDSMEESIKKSRESLSPLNGQYALTAKPSPPPVSSLGGAMPKSNDKSEELHQPKVTFAPVTSRDGKEGEKETTKKRKPVDVEEKLRPAIKTPTFVFRPAKEESKEHTPVFGLKMPDSSGLMAVKVESKMPDAATKNEQMEEDASAKPTFEFGKSPKGSASKAKVAAAVGNADTDMQKHSPSSSFLFGKDKEIKVSYKSDWHNKNCFLNATEFELKSILMLQATGTRTAMPKPDEVPAEKPSSGDWGAAFLKQNSQAALEAANAAKNEAEGSTQKTEKPAPFFSFGVSTASTGPSSTPAFSSPGKEEKSLPEEKGFVATDKPVVDSMSTIGASAKDEEPEPQAKEGTPVVSTGWDADFLKNNAKTASETTAAVEKELKKDSAIGNQETTLQFKFGSGAAPQGSESKIKPFNFSSASSAPVSSLFGAQSSEQKPKANEAQGSDQKKPMLFGLQKSGASVPVSPNVEETEGAKSTPIASQDIAAAPAFESTKETKSFNSNAAKVSEPSTLAPFGILKDDITAPPEPSLAGPVSESAGAIGKESLFGKTVVSTPAVTEEKDFAASSAPSLGTSSLSILGSAPAPSFNFGSKTDQQEKVNNSAPATFKFGSSTGSAGFKFGQSDAGATINTATTGASAPVTFGASTSQPSSTLFSFGANTMPSSTAPTFGTASSPAATETSQMKTDGVNAGQPSSGPGVGQPGTFQFGSTSANASKMSFGEPVTSSGFGAPSTSMPNFGASANSQTAGGFASSFNPSAQPSSGGFGTSFGVANGPFGASSSSSAFGAPSASVQPGAFGFGGASASGMNAEVFSGGFGANPVGFAAPQGQQAPAAFGSSFGQMGGASPFPQPSGPSQMIPNNDGNPNPFGASQGGFNMGSTGTSQSTEGRRRLKARRRRN